MTQSMSRWMLAAVIAAVMVIVSAGMGAAATIALDDDGADFASVSKQKLIDHGIEISDVYDVREVTLINGKKFTVVKGNVNGNIKSFTINPNGEISPGVQKIIDEKKKAYSQLSKAELKLDQELLKIVKEETDSGEDKIPVFISVIGKESLHELRDYLESHKLTSKVELQNYLPGIATDVNVVTLNELVELDYVSAIYFDSTVEAYLDWSVPTIRVNGNNFPSWTDNTLGSGVTVAIVDFGVNTTHPNINRNFGQNSIIKLPQLGAIDENGQFVSNDKSDHATAIAGIIASNDSTFKGVTPGVSLLDVDLMKESSWSEVADGIEWVVAGPDGIIGNEDDADIIQMSIGSRTLGNTGLDGLSDFVDAVVFQEDIVFTVAVGQNRTDPIGQNNWEPVVSPAEAYNVISVGATDDKNSIDLNDDTIYYHGFYGTIDGRQKPDIVAPGFRIASLKSNWRNGDLFSMWYTGTSFAAPHVAGAAAILLSNNPALSAKQVKAILLNTPNRNPYLSDDERERVGYGLLNVNEAYKNIHNSLIGTIRDTEGDELYYELTLGDIGDSRITMVWERQANAGDASVPDAGVTDLIDLNMYLFKDGNVVDWTTDFRNNVEQIKYSSNSGNYVLAIKTFNIYGDTDVEVPFALAYYGDAVQKNPPSLQSNLIAPNVVGSRSTFTLSLSVTNEGELPAYGVDSQVNLPDDFSIVSGPNRQLLGEIGAGETKTRTLEVRAPTVESAQTFSMSAVAFSESYPTSYHDRFGDADTISITVDPNVVPHDDFGYTFIDSDTPEGPTYNWIEISGTGTEVLPNSDDSWVEDIGLGFFFNYYGTDYSQLAISNNGLLFSGGTTWQYINAPITQTPGVHGFIAPFWDDIVTWGSGTIYYQTLGTAPNRMFVVEWYDNQHYHSSTLGVTFEAILYEGSNNIFFQYKDVEFGNVYSAVGGDNPPYDNGGSATVGIEGPAGDDGLQYSFNEQVIDPGLAIRFKFPQFAGTNLYLSKQAPASKDHGSAMTYTLHYHNFGDTPAQNVVLEDALPAGVEFVSASDGGSYNSGTGKVTWNIGSVTPNGHGYETVTVRISQSAQIGTVIRNDASISTSNLEVRYDDNEAHARTTVTGSSLPPDVTVEPNNGGTGTPSIYWHNPITFSYHSCPTATGVDIRIQVNDGGPDITGSMAGGPPDWTYTTTFYPRHGRATVTYTVHGCDVETVTFDIYIDPAGYIYDADTGERIAGATVWLQWSDGEGGWVNVPTGEDPAISQPDENPLITGEDGWYQWDVLEGSYRVHVEASGYYSADSIVVSIPPPVTDLHVGLTHLPDTTPPAITNVGAASDSNSAEITWETDEVSNSLVGYGTSSESYPFSENGGEMVLSHSITLTGLTPDTLYYYVVSSTDAQDNSAESPEFTFRTLTLSDIEQPIIESVTLYPANTTAGSSIDISVSASDNVGVDEVTADGTPLTNSDGLWQGSITAPSTTGDYTLTIRAEDAAGNFAETTVDYSVVEPTGSLGVGIAPKVTTASTSGTTIDYTVKIKSVQNFDDTVHVYVSMDGLPASYQMPMDWFDWTEQDVRVAANSEISLPLQLTIPPGEPAGGKAFRVKANSNTWITTAYDTGVISIS